MIDSQKAVQMFLSWFRVFIAASLACWLSGVTDPNAMLNAGLVSVLPVIIRFLNPADPVYGRNQ